MQNGLPDSPRSGRSQGGGPESIAKPSAVPVVLGMGPSDDRGPHLGPLPTVHEDSELYYPPTELNKPIPLTLKALMATKEDRMNVEIRPVVGPYSGWVLVHETVNNLHDQPYLFHFAWHFI